MAVEGAEEVPELRQQRGEVPPGRRQGGEGPEQDAHREHRRRRPHDRAAAVCPKPPPAGRRRGVLTLLPVCSSVLSLLAPVECTVS